MLGSAGLGTLIDACWEQGGAQPLHTEQCGSVPLQLTGPVLAMSAQVGEKGGLAA